jgi:hypothetical protein
MVAGSSQCNDAVDGMLASVYGVHPTGGSGRTSSTNASSIDFGVSMTRLMSTPATGADASGSVTERLTIAPAGCRRCVELGL